MIAIKAVLETLSTITMNPDHIVDCFHFVLTTMMTHINQVFVCIARM